MDTGTEITKLTINTIRYVLLNRYKTSFTVAPSTFRIAISLRRYWVSNNTNPKIPDKEIRTEARHEAETIRPVTFFIPVKLPDNRFIILYFNRISRIDLFKCLPYMLCRLFHIRPLPYLYTGNRHTGILFINDESQRVSTGPRKNLFSSNSSVIPITIPLSFQ